MGGIVRRSKVREHELAIILRDYWRTCATAMRSTTPLVKCRAAQERAVDAIFHAFRKYEPVK